MRESIIVATENTEFFEIFFNLSVVSVARKEFVPLVSLLPTAILVDSSSILPILTEDAPAEVALLQILKKKESLMTNKLT